MAQHRMVPSALSFNLNFSESSHEDSSKYINENEIEKLPYIPKPRNHVQKLFVKQPAGKRHARESVLGKLIIKNKSILPFSSTPKLSSLNNASSEISFSPITNKMEENNLIRTRNFDDFPPAKRLKTGAKVFENVNAADLNSRSNTNAKNINIDYVYRQDVYDQSPSAENYPTSFKQPSKKLVQQDVSFLKPLPPPPNTKTLQNKKENITVRKHRSLTDAENILETVDAIDHSKFVNSDRQNQSNCKNLSSTIYRNISSSSQSHLPYGNKGKQLKDSKNAFDSVLDMSASVISISSECQSTCDGNEVLQMEEIANTKASKANIGINTTEVKALPKANKRSVISTQNNVITTKKCTVGTQKNAIRDISTNTTPFTDNSDNQLTEESPAEREKSRKSIGTNTTYKKEALKMCKPSTSNTILTKKSVNPKISMQSTTRVRESLRPRTKKIDYSYSTSLSSNSAQPPSEATTVSNKNNYTSVKQTKKRKKSKSIIPPSLRKPTSKLKKANEQLTSETLTGFYGMDLQKNDENKENNSGTRRGRPPSIYVQSHVIGSGPLKNVILKKLSTRLTTNKNRSETTENKTQTKSRSSRIKKSIRDGLRTTNSSEQIEDSNSDDTTFKKPLPVKHSRTSASTSNTSSASAVGFDRAHVISSPLIETIDELSDDECTEINSNTVKEISSAHTQNNSKNKGCSSDVTRNHLPVKNIKKSSVNTSLREKSAIESRNNKLSINESAPSNVQRKSSANGKMSLKDSGVGTASSKLVLDSSTVNEASPKAKKMAQFDIRTRSVTKLDVDSSTISPMDEAIYEIEDLSSRPNSFDGTEKLVEAGKSNSIQASYKCFTTGNQPVVQEERLVAGPNRTNSKETTFDKPRKSVTFSEPVTLVTEKSAAERHLRSRKTSDVLSDHRSCKDISELNTALALSDNRNSRHPPLMDSLDDFENSDLGQNNNGALCTLIDNKPVLLRKWHSDMPDLNKATESSVVKYTLKNIPIVGGTVATGCFLLGPGEKKPKQATMKHVLFFHILSGEARMNVQGAKFTARAGHHFIIPLGCIYSITNTNFEERLVLSFVKIAPNL